MSPYKMRQVIDLVRGKPAKYATELLANLNKKGAFLLAKVLKSAIANAKIKGYEDKGLFISKIIADGGPVLKRYRAATFGRATTIKKRTAHVVVELDTTEKIIDVKPNVVTPVARKQTKKEPKG
jgi:large subunit ribosomal protein L22